MVQVQDPKLIRRLSSAASQTDILDAESSKKVLDALPEVESV